MKHRLFIIMALCLSTVGASASQVAIQTRNTTMVLDVTEGKTPQYLYFGTRLNDQELQHLQLPRNGRMEAYPAYGLNTPAEAAFAMRHGDGNLSTALVYKGKMTEEQGGNTTTTVITLEDTVYPITVKLCFKAFINEDVIEAWTEITNG